MTAIQPIHPGEILKEEFMSPLALSINQLAKDIGVPANRISALVNKKRAVTADTALRLGHYFGVSSQFWLNLQMLFELDMAKVADQGKLAKMIIPYRQKYPQ